MRLTSSRAILFDQQQNIIGISQKEFTQHYPREGWVEHDPMEIYSSQYAVMMEVIAQTGVSPAEVAAIGIDGMKKKRQKAMETIAYIPMLSPDIVTGISLMMLFLFAGIRLGYGTMLLAHITFNLPYVIFSVLPKLRQLNPAHYEAALDLGAKPGYALRKIVLPQILPGIVTGFIFAFTLSIDDFVVSYFTSQDVSNLSMTIYSMARRGLSPKINALSTIMFVSVMILLVIINVRSSRQNRKEKKA